jgi:ATP-dependent DNA ligase
MLADSARELPLGEGWTYEPKWDGFRCLAFVEGGAVDLRSRHGKPLARYFPEVVEALLALDRDCVLDGELLACVAGTPDFGALMARLHPAASRVERLRRETPASYVAFDLLGVDGENVCARPFAERRERLVALLDGADVQATPATTDPEQAAEWLAKPLGGAIDGVVAKAAHQTYQPGKRAMVKVKPARTVDCVVAGLRLAEGPVVSSLLLGLYDGDALRHIGVVQAFSKDERVRLTGELAPYVVPLAGHPWEHGFALEGGHAGRLSGAPGRWRPGMTQDWVPLRPALVAEVAYTQVDGVRFRHPARLVRWRPDRDPESCHVGQLK